MKFEGNVKHKTSSLRQVKSLSHFVLQQISSQSIKLQQTDPQVPSQYALLTSSDFPAMTARHCLQEDEEGGMNEDLHALN